MALTLFCVLSLFLLNTFLYSGHAQDAELTFDPDSRLFFAGESVAFRCDMREGNSNDWRYTFTRNAQQFVSDTNNSYAVNLTADMSGEYQCVGRRKDSANLTKQSNIITLSVSAHRPVAILRADRATIPAGGAVTLSCSVRGSAGWTYEWFRLTSGSHEDLIVTDGAGDSISISQEGVYQCRGQRGDPLFYTEYSDEHRIERTLFNKVFVTLHPNWTQTFSGENITVTCEIEGGGDTEWEFEWRTTSSNTPPTHREYRISSAAVSHSGRYWCKGRNDSYTSTEWSDAFLLKVSSSKPTVIADKRTIPTGGNVTLNCSVGDSSEWTYRWFRRSSVFSESHLVRNDEAEEVISVSQGGIYHCRGARGSPVFFTEESDAVAIERRVSNKAVVSLQPNWPLIFSGETITVRCDIYAGENLEDVMYGNPEWVYEWSRPDFTTMATDNKYRISGATVSSSGNYRCMGKQKQDAYSSTEWSDIIILTVSPHRPKAELSADSTDIPVGGNVTLTCSVTSSGWKYFWYRGEKTSEPLTSQDAVFLSTGRISVSQGGLYWCRGGRGEPVYHTEYSDSVSIHRTVSNGAVVTIKPSWPEIYFGESVTLRCEIHGEDAEWEYEWMSTSSNKPSTQNQYRIMDVSSSDTGDYWCRGRPKRSEQNSTGWSISFRLTASYQRPQPVLTVSPSWLSPGDSVTLSCSVEHPSAGWRFSWYKAVPKLSYRNIFGSHLDMIGYSNFQTSYSYELLPDSSTGTEQDSYSVHGQTHTARYVCRAARGDPGYHTDYSEPQFALSGASRPSASLSVSPDRAQHFTSDSVSLSCEGNSTEWRVRRFTDLRYLSDCSYWGRMTGSTCHIIWSGVTGVYWCEAGSGEFSNAVNITYTYDGIILKSPVHPVTEGDNVTLGCHWENIHSLSNVIFYKNEKIIQDSDKKELKISAVSKSDEGSYSCEHSGEKSPQSWLSVKKSSSSPSAGPLVAGLVVGLAVVVVVPLVLLCWYKRSKDTGCHRFIRSHRAGLSSADVETVHPDENQQQIYSSLLHGDACVYETIAGNAGRGERADAVRSHHSSEIQLKYLEERRIHDDDDSENSEYGNVNPGPN